MDLSQIVLSNWAKAVLLFKVTVMLINILLTVIVFVFTLYNPYKNVISNSGPPRRHGYSHGILR